MSLTWQDWAGLAGVAMVLVAYLLMQTRHLDGRGVGYLLLNGIGSLLVLLSLFKTFNLSAFVIQCFWIAISIYGLLRWARERRG